MSAVSPDIKGWLGDIADPILRQQLSERLDAAVARLELWTREARNPTAPQLPLHEIVEELKATETAIYQAAAASVH